MTAAGIRPASPATSMRPGDVARARLRTARTALRAIIVAQAVLFAAVAAVTVAALRDASGGSPDRSTAWWDAAIIAATLAGALVTLWRAAPRGVSLEGTALWLESRVPALRYALVTLADPQAAVPDAAARTLDAVVRDAQWNDVLRRAAVRALLPPIGVLLVMLAVPRVLPAHLTMGSGGSRTRAAATAATVDRLARVRASVTPPAYSGLPAQRVDDPSGIEALVGSRIVVVGAGNAAGLTARISADTSAGASLATASTGDGWRVTFLMPETPAALRLGDGARTRLVVLAPRPDASPRISLSLPARDTVLRAATGALPLAATADDDLGLASTQFEWIVSSGEGESYTFRSGVVARSAFGGAKHGVARGTLVLDAMALKPGDLVHLRAVARDRNPSPSHPSGASETRTIRVARPGEYDSVAVDAAPPAMGDTSQLGQRMLLQLTEALAKRARALARPTLLAESQRIAQDQARLRKRVGDLVFQRLGEGEGEETSGETERRAKMSPEELLAAASEATGQDLSKPLEGAEEDSPVLAVNRPLLEAYNHMWDAGRALEIGEPARAIPPMRLAIAALQRARAAERIYLRGKPPRALVDIAKVRLAARISADTMHPAARAPRTPLDARARARAASLDRAVALLGGDAADAADASAAADTLAMLRVNALTDAPALATALGAAVDALRAGRDATAALVRARRLAAGATARADSLGGWAW